MGKILFLLTVGIIPGFATAITSAGSGNWNLTSTWIGGVVPGNGDTVIIGNGHTVVIPSGYHAIVGVSGPMGLQHSASGPVAAIACASDSGTGILTVSGTLTYRGNVEQCTAVWNVGPNAILEHDSSLASTPNATHYRWIVGVAIFPDTAILVGRGVTGNRMIIRNATGSGTFYGFTYNNNSDQGSGQVDFEYATIDGCGSASTGCAEGAWHGPLWVMRCDHCLVTNSGPFIGHNSGSGTLANYTITNTSITSMAGSYVLQPDCNSGNVLLDTIYTDGVIFLNAGGGGIDATLVHVRNIFIRDLVNTTAMYLGGGGLRIAEFDRVLRITDQQSYASTGSFTYIPGGNLTRLMGLMNAVTNPHVFYGPVGITGQNDVIDGGYFEKIGAGTDGDAILGASGPATLTTIKNTVFACSAVDGISYSLSSTALPTSKTFSMLNNTYCGKDDGAGSARGFGFEVPGTAAVGMLAAAQDNIVFSVTNVPTYLVHKGPTGTAQVGTYANVDYNWKWNVSAGPYFDQAGGTYSPDPPGVHDSTGDPQFVQQRHFLEWGQMLDPSITSWTDIVGKFSKMNDDSGYDSRFTILNAYNWLRDGYRPQNAAVATASHAGGLVGAMAPPSGGISNITIPGVTNTQFVLKYTAPDSTICSLEVSKSPTYAPVVHDVDGGLFTNANLDSRVGELVNGLNRTMVIGGRISQVALDALTYSRSLQANTTHYYRISCGSGGSIQATGSVVTANIPMGVTYQDVPQMDQSNPGLPLIPYLNPTDRTQVVNDPHTGLGLHRISLPADSNGGTGPFMYFGGFTWPCSNNLMGSPAIGYLCTFAQGSGGYGALYYFIPSTGESKYLGYVNGFAYPYINPVDGKIYNIVAGDLIQLTYTGGYTTVSPGTAASVSSTTIVSGLPAAIQAFNSGFNPAAFGCGPGQAVGDFIDITCRIGGQDTLGWLAAVRISTGSVVAASAVFNNIQCRWCVIHEVLPQYDAASMSYTPHAGVGGNGVGGGPFQTHYTSGTTTIVVGGEPVDTAGTDPYIPLAQAGDKFIFLDGTGEVVTIQTKNSATSWTLTAPLSFSHSGGIILEAQCAYRQILWSFLLDPFGVDTTNTTFRADPNWPIGGHDDSVTNYMLTEHWQVRGPQPLLTQTGPLNVTINDSPLFAGALGQCFGNGCTSHPSANPPGIPWLSDFFAWSGQYADNSTWIPLGGQLFKRVNSTFGPLIPKYLPMAGNYLDVSPTNVTGVVGDTGKFCLANNATECNAGSTKGDAYVNQASIVCNDATGSSTTYTCPSPVTYPGSYTAGYNVVFVPQVTNSGVGPTLNINSLGALTLTDGGGTPLGIGALVGGTIYALHYHGGSPPYLAVTTLTCGSPGGLCLTNGNAYGSGIVQLGLDGTKNRVISQGLSGLYNSNNYPTAHTTTDGGWTLFSVGDYQYVPPSQMMVAKLPPYAVSDGVDRSKFVPVSVSLTAPIGLGVLTADLKFGYLEQGTASQMYCTSRKEGCIANTNLPPPTDGFSDPFKFYTSDAWTGISCVGGSGCSIIVPILPLHIAYVQAEYRDSGNAVVATDPMFVIGDYVGITPPGGLGGRLQMGEAVRKGLNK